MNASLVPARQPRRLAGLGTAAVFAAALGAAAPAHAQTAFSLSFIAGTTLQQQAAFTQAAGIWSSILADSVTVNLTVGTAALNPGVLASASSTMVRHTYASTRTALANDATSANDAIAVANLQPGPNLNLLINGTSNNPNGAGSLTPYLDNGGINTSQAWMSNANAKALGLATNNNPSGQASGCITALCDGYIAFSTGFAWDYDPSDGITAGTYDFVGIAIHEIGHALGFISGVDVLDFNTLGAFTDDQFNFVAPLDFYRCTAASAAQNALDWTVGSGTDPKLFSLDGCDTSLASFATGQANGDGRQASHWKDDLGIGLMDPTSSAGELKILTQMDITAFDVIGWNLNNTVATPAPASALVFVFGLAGLAIARRRNARA
jgi:hypothetical protein